MKPNVFSRAKGMLIACADSVKVKYCRTNEFQIKMNEKNSMKFN